MNDARPPEQTTRRHDAVPAVRRVQPRSSRPDGGPLWLGPLLGCSVGLCALIIVGVVIISRPFSAIQGTEQPLVVVTVTPTPTPRPTVTPLPTVTALPTPEPSPTPEGLFIGGDAIVSGTGSALRLRSDPGLQSTTLKTVTDGTRLLILEGPRDADGLRWWRLQDRTDGAEGWAAETYLTPATTP